MYGTVTCMALMRGWGNIETMVANIKFGRRSLKPPAIETSARFLAHAPTHSFLSSRPSPSPAHFRRAQKTCQAFPTQLQRTVQLPFFFISVVIPLDHAADTLP